MARNDKEKILKAISTNVDDLLKQKVNTSVLKQNLLMKILSRNTSIQNIVDCSVLSIAIYLLESDNGKDATDSKG